MTGAGWSGASRGDAVAITMTAGEHTRGHRQRPRTVPVRWPARRRENPPLGVDAAHLAAVQYSNWRRRRSRSRCRLAAPALGDDRNRRSGAERIGPKGPPRRPCGRGGRFTRGHTPTIAGTSPAGTERCRGAAPLVTASPPPIGRSRSPVSCAAGLARGVQLRICRLFPVIVRRGELIPRGPRLCDL